MANNNEKMTANYSFYSGADMSMVIGTQIVGTLQAISYSVNREKGPVYVMKGTPDPIGTARGKRAVAGTLVFLMIDRSALLNHIKDFAPEQAKFWANASDVQYDWRDNNISDKFDGTDALFNNPADPNENDAFLDISSMRKEENAWYTDQIMPFDVNLIASNEQGQRSKRVISQIELLNEGGGMSIDDLVVEEAYSYLANGLTPWIRI